MLSEVDARTLATALKDEDDKLVNKVFGNLSKRARESLSEEMEFMGTIKQDEQQAAQKQITDIIARLDQAGELIMVDG